MQELVSPSGFLEDHKIELERKRFELEQQRFIAENRIKKIELSLKRRELILKLREEHNKKRAGVSPAMTAVIAALIGLLGTGLGTFLQGRQNLQLERQKFESSRLLEKEKQAHELVIKMISTDDRGQAAKNLLFLVSAGFLEDRNGQIATLAKDPERIPVLPSSDSSHDSIFSPGKRREILQGIFSPNQVVSDTSRDAFLVLGTASDSDFLVVINGAISGANDRHVVLNALAILNAWGSVNHSAAGKVALKRLFARFEGTSDAEIRQQLEKLRNNIETNRLIGTYD